MCRTIVPVSTLTPGLRSRRSTLRSTYSGPVRLSPKMMLPKPS